MINVLYADNFWSGRNNQYMYNALSVADYILDYCGSHGRAITNFKLNGMLYFVQAEFLVGTKYHRPCFSDSIEAWNCGVVIPKVNSHYSMFGAGIIIPKKDDVLKPYYNKISEDDKARIDGVLKKVLGYYTDTDLKRLICSQKPWKEAYREGFHNKISNESIYEYFKE